MTLFNPFSSVKGEDMRVEPDRADRVCLRAVVPHPAAGPRRAAAAAAHRQPAHDPRPGRLHAAPIRPPLRPLRRRGGRGQVAVAGMT